MTLRELKQDDRNANKGTVRGHELVKESLRKYGAGRSILIDRDGKIIAGNKTASEAQAAGLSDDVIVVPTDGTKLVVVQRTDLDLNDSKARQLAVADNRTSELGLDWDPAMLAEFPTEQLQPFFTAVELAEAVGEKVTPTDPNAEYVGMPDYTNEDQTGVRDIIIHFQSDSAVKEFAKLLNQTISDKTKYLWFPKDDRAELQSEKYVTEVLE